MRTKLLFLVAVLFTLQILSGIANAITIEHVDINPSVVSPGKIIEIKLEITNHLDDDVENVEISLDLSKAPFAPKKTSEIFFEEIREDKSKEIRFELKADANAEAGTYKIPVTISYKYNNQTKTKTSYISLIVNAKPNLTVSLDSVLYKNSRNKLQIQITNNGLARAKFLEIELGNGNYNLLSNSKVYIGNLDSNDFDTASFDVYVKDSSFINLPIKLNYKDPVNNEYSEEIILQARAYSQDEAIKLGLKNKSSFRKYVIWVAIAVITIFFIRWRRKRVRNKYRQI